jgi:hypothetical protein
MILLIIGYLPFFIAEVEFIINDFKSYEYKNLFNILFLLLDCIAFSIGETLSKIAFNQDLIFPEKLVFDRGVLTLLIHCFIIFPILYFSGQIYLYKKIIQFLSISFLLTIIVLLFYILFLLFQNIISMKILYFYTPIHISFLNSIILCLICMIGYHPEKELTILRIILYLISLILIIFGSLLFCEIIIINICGLNNHTKYGFIETVELDRDTLNKELENMTDNEDNIEDAIN